MSRNFNLRNITIFSSLDVTFVYGVGIYTQYLNVINHAIERQREIYQQLLEESKPQVDEKAEAGSKEHKVVS